MTIESQLEYYLSRIESRHWILLAVVVLVCAVSLFYTFSKIPVIERIRKNVNKHVKRIIIEDYKPKANISELDRSGFFGLFMQNKNYWICTILTALLCYGFTLTNATLLTDDLVFDSHYSNNHVKLAVGRWGYLIFRDVLFTFLYLPFWRAFNGMCLIITGSTMYCGLYRKYSGGKFDNKTATIFTCVAISFPWIADLFVLTETTILMGWIFTLAGVSLYFSCKWIIEKKNALYLIPSSVILGYATAFYEPAMVFYLAGGFSLLFLHFLFKEKSGGFSRFLIMSVQFAVITVLGVIVLRLGAIFFQYLLSIEPMYYREQLLFHDTSSVWALIKSVIRFTLSFTRIFIFPPSDGNTIRMIIWAASVCVVITSFILSVSFKKLSIFLAGAATVVSAYGLYFALGILHMLNRNVYTFLLLIAFASALLYQVIRNIEIKRVKLKYLAVLIVVWLVLFQSREMNQIIHLDYQRHQRDVMILNTIVHDLGRGREKPVVFVGFIPDTLPRREFVGVSLFRINRETPWTELDVFWISGFFRAQGFPLQEPIEFDRDEICRYIVDMPSWPQSGYIKELDDYVIVRLGYSYLD